MSSSSRLYGDTDSSRVELTVFVTPVELFFTPNKRRLQLTIFNPYGDEAHFRIMTTSPDRFDVGLTKGTIKPNRRIDVTIKLLSHTIEELPAPTEELQTIDYFRVTLQLGPLKGNKPIRVYWSLNAESLESDDATIGGSDNDKSLKSSYRIRSSKSSPTTSVGQISQSNLSPNPALHLSQRAFTNQRLPLVRAGRQPTQNNNHEGYNVNLDSELCKKAKSYQDQLETKATGLLSQVAAFFSISYEMKLGCSFALGLFTYRLISTLPD